MNPYFVPEVRGTDVIPVRMGENMVDRPVGDALAELAQISDADSAIDGDGFLVSHQQEHFEPPAFRDLIASRREFLDGIPVLSVHLISLNDKKCSEMALPRRRRAIPVRRPAEFESSMYGDSR